MKSFPLFFLLSVAFAALLLLSACDKTPPPTRAHKPIPEVTVITAHIQAVPLTHESTGLLAPTKIAQVRARVAGIILKRVYTEGTDVKPGQILFQIDPAALKAVLHTVKATLAKAQANAVNAALIARRSQNLAHKGLVSTQDRDTALANKRTTAALVKAAQAKVTQARINLGYTTITAPIAGHAGKSRVTEGALVGQGKATLLTTIEQINPIYVNFSQSVSSLRQLKLSAKGHSANNMDIGTKVEILLPDGSVYPHLGQLNFSAQTVDPRTGTLSLRAIIPNPKRQLLPGMFVNLRLTMGQLKRAFLLPQAAVQRDHMGAYVMVVAASGKVERHRVQTHGMTQTDWIITGKLADGDQVITTGLQKVKPGMVVKADLSAKSASNH